MGSCLVFIVGIILAVAGAVMINYGWMADPREWAMIIAGGVVALIGAVLTGGTVFDELM